MGRSISRAAAPFYDARRAARLVHESGDYLIGRVVTFEDPVLAEKHPELAIHTSDGSVWRTSAGLGWQSLVGAELIVASSGIGYLLVKGQSNISTSIVMSGMIAIGIVGFAIDALLRVLERRINARRGIAG